ncbi:two-component system sensor histidine kinase YesM [Paenibacillus sp. V4I3]|uniref:sensor histidine kinase n=1 Tax=unclassified Paenibacillus TaxID=185978 RepID=UPI00277D77CF|nr:MULTISPECIES: histidine kinase [unclassified Paenibacillus]MDQ0874467.1 two-component system sensor histidine kinase YesM [Paenibacillus sp. V4I3]MDQ0889775.1 two-component system sensor histidine kinase YesM [Paenibacillus sp. V4I9]
MKHRWNTFSKMVLLIVLLLMPIGLIYSYTNHTSVKVIEQELLEKSLKRLSFLTSQMDNIVDQLTISSIIVSRDASINAPGALGSSSDAFKQLELQEEIVQKLNLLSASSRWDNRLIIYLPKAKQVLSNDYKTVYNDEYVKNLSTRFWQYHPDPTGGNAYFTKAVMSPLLVNKGLLEAESVVEVQFTESNLVRVLKDYQYDGRSNPFFYKPLFEPIMDKTGDSSVTQQIIAILNREPLDEDGHRIVEINHEQYMVYYVRSKSLGWHVVDYLPLKEVLAPITKSRNWFYATIVLMLLISLLATVFLYRQVQLPIQLLLRGVMKLQTGSFSHRINYHPRNEFDYLFNRFNEMAEEIQRLLENVYVENIRFRDAKLKHLQSQINPHFLSNCMFFIKNMIAIDDKQAATSMVLNLSEYFRYITMLEHTLTTLREELKLIENYLTIQNLRMERFHYEIDIPEEMLDLQIPRLMVQPIIENTIIHGIEKKEQYGIIIISGEWSEGVCRIHIDDNGVGLSDQQLIELEQKMSSPHDQEAGCGLWNVHQRLAYQFDQQSGLMFSHSTLGGLRVAIQWNV